MLVQVHQWSRWSLHQLLLVLFTGTSCKNSLTRQTDSHSVRLFPLSETEGFGWRMNFMDKAETYVLLNYCSEMIKLVTVTFNYFFSFLLNFRSLEQSIWKTKLRLCSKMLKFCLLGSEPFLLGGSFYFSSFF